MHIKQSQYLILVCLLYIKSVFCILLFHQQKSQNILQFELYWYYHLTMKKSLESNKSLKIIIL